MVEKPVINYMKKKVKKFTKSNTFKFLTENSWDNNWDEDDD